MAVKKDKNELGDSGTIIYGGFINTDEYNVDLVGTRGLKEYDKMRRADGSVKASLLAIKLPLQSARWIVKPAGEKPDDEAAAEFIQYNLMNRMDWNSTLRQILTHLEFGFSVFEQVFEPVTYDGKEYIGLKKLGYRKQSTIFSWEMANGEPGVQQISMNYGSVSIPLEKLSVFTHDQEGDNYEGISVLRAAYQHYSYKKVMYKVDAIAQERQGLGVPILRVPPGATEADKKKARNLMRNMRANEEAYIELPEGFEVEILDMKANSTRDIMKSIDHHDRQITKNVLAQFLEIGSSASSGSYNASDNQSKLFMQSVEAVGKNIAEVYRRTVIKNLVQLNGWNVTELPTVEIEDINEDDITKLADALQKLSNAGIVVPDDPLEDHIRKVMNLPERVEPEDGEEPTPRQRKTDPQNVEDITKKKKPDDEVDNEEVDDALKTASLALSKVAIVEARDAKARG